MTDTFVPKYLFLTKGVGWHKEQLASFEVALRKAGIAEFNLVTVSSIFPPHCKILSSKAGLEMLKPGQIIFTVRSQAQTDEPHRLISASIGVARPTDPSLFGYLSEHHDFGKKEEEVSDYAEDLAAGMLATTLGETEFDPEESWDNKRELYKITNKIVKSRSITQTAVGRRGVWTTVIAAAVLIL
ncbi:MAG TPA: arginine decarboxylase, pyruvoyl-dependent [Acidobacteriota bacterium]|nr:arginine decarboxylase, pyruvoyl-dependent [Acidobacteriota bacterium]